MVPVESGQCQHHHHNHKLANFLAQISRSYYVFLWNSSQMIDFHFHKLNLVWLILCVSSCIVTEICLFGKLENILIFQKGCSSAVNVDEVPTHSISTIQPPPVKGVNLSDERISAYQTVCNTDFEFEFGSFNDHPWNGRVPKGREEIFHSHQNFRWNRFVYLRNLRGIGESLKRHFKDVDPISGIITLA